MRVYMQIMVEHAIVWSGLGMLEAMDGFRMHGRKGTSDSAIIYHGQSGL